MALEITGASAGFGAGGASPLQALALQNEQTRAAEREEERRLAGSTENRPGFRTEARGNNIDILI